ncbi:unnamed protein product [Closterium sp. NIES-64]|nr:unnamed protein product [Closterium sp. NIES-64]
MGSTRSIFALLCTVTVALLFLLPPSAHAELTGTDGVVAKSAGSMGATTRPRSISEVGQAKLRGRRLGRHHDDDDDDDLDCKDDDDDDDDDDDKKYDDKKYDDKKYDDKKYDDKKYDDKKYDDKKYDDNHGDNKYDDNHGDNNYNNKYSGNHGDNKYSGNHGDNNYNNKYSGNHGDNNYNNNYNDNHDNHDDNNYDSKYEKMSCSEKYKMRSDKCSYKRERCGGDEYCGATNDACERRAYLLYDKCKRGKWTCENWCDYNRLKCVEDYHKSSSTCQDRVEYCYDKCKGNDNYHKDYNHSDNKGSGGGPRT